MRRKNARTFASASGSGGNDFGSRSGGRLVTITLPAIVRFPSQGRRRNPLSLRPQRGYRANSSTHDRPRPPLVEHEGNRNRDSQDYDGANCIDLSGHSLVPPGRSTTASKPAGLFETRQPGDLTLQFLRQMGQPRCCRIVTDRNGKAPGTDGLLQQVGNRGETQRQARSISHGLCQRPNCSMV
jgi:hypothetical protein